MWRTIGTHNIAALTNSIVCVVTEIMTLVNVISASIFARRLIAVWICVRSDGLQHLLLIYSSRIRPLLSRRTFKFKLVAHGAANRAHRYDTLVEFVLVRALYVRSCSVVGMVHYKARYEQCYLSSCKLTVGYLFGCLSWNSLLFWDLREPIP